MHIFQIPKMSCGGCVDTISKALKQVDESAVIECDLAGRTVKVDSEKDRQALADAMSSAGYPPA